MGGLEGLGGEGWDPSCSWKCHTSPGGAAGKRPLCSGLLHAVLVIGRGQGEGDRHR